MCLLVCPHSLIHEWRSLNRLGQATLTEIPPGYEPRHYEYFKVHFSGWSSENDRGDSRAFLASDSSFYGSSRGSIVRWALWNLSACDLRQCDERSIEVRWLGKRFQSILLVSFSEGSNVKFDAWNRLEVIPKDGITVQLSIISRNWNRRKQRNYPAVTRRCSHHENYLHHVHGLPHPRIDRIVSTPCSPSLPPDFRSFAPSLMMMMVL